MSYPFFRGMVTYSLIGEHCVRLEPLLLCQRWYLPWNRQRKATIAYFSYTPSLLSIGMNISTLKFSITFLCVSRASKSISCWRPSLGGNAGVVSNPCVYSASEQCRGYRLAKLITASLLKVTFPHDIGGYSYISTAAMTIISIRKTMWSWSPTISTTTSSGWIFLKGKRV